VQRFDVHFVPDRARVVAAATTLTLITTAQKALSPAPVKSPRRRAIPPGILKRGNEFIDGERAKGIPHFSRLMVIVAIPSFFS
jgi:hypothetical protein